MASDSCDEHSPDSHWTLDELAFRLLHDQQRDLNDDQRRQRDLDEAIRVMSRSTIWRVLDAADLKPHRSIYWLNSHDPDFDTKARDICNLYLKAPQWLDEGTLVLSSDEKGGMQMLQRKYPSRPASSGHPEHREFESIRHGTRTLIATLGVADGRIISDLGPTRTALDWVNHLRHVVRERPDAKKYHWVVDNLNTHWSLDVCLQVARWEGETKIDRKRFETGKQRRSYLSDPNHRHVFHFTPLHGSWLNQVEIFFGVLSRKFLKRGDFASAAEFESRLREWLRDYNERRAKAYQWTFTGDPLVSGEPKAIHARRWGISGFGPKPPLWRRILQPPRNYNRKAKLVADL